ncbi:aminoglycoside phosphotransferase family protein [Calothrix rhizosoleniae]|uniref:aminoglycoside phosphotransferase family protein n=1 Tax=Calothrix rhizosoleniae TaxID=888997 RepID=UPI001F1EAB55|nr:aminoglycoside phosphotransferase family protein [Calothrix rhizosoleniae]
MSETKPEKSHQGQTSPLFAILSFFNQAMPLKGVTQGAIAKFFQGKWESYLYGILPHPTEPRVLMLSDKSGYFLPYVRVNKMINPSNFGTIKKVIEQELGISLNILYAASKDYDKSKRQIRGIYVLERNGSITELKEGSWIDIETLRNLSLKQPEHKLVIEEYLREIESDNIPELRPPWSKVGWFDCATQWIEEQLLELNYKQLSPIKCIKSWGISCILRVHTSAGNIYFKEASTLPLFCNEPAVTAELANLFPEHIPTVLGINTERHWMLLADFGEPVGRNAPVKLQKDIYHLLAQIQIKSVAHRDNLLSIGCLDRRLARLETQIDVLFNDENVLSEMNTAEINQLNTLAPYLKNLCFQLAEYQIPQTLVHGDLHLHNVAFSQDNYLLFDWTDSCISHPFFDMFELFFPRNNKPFLSPLKVLRDEYLTQWTLYEPRSRLIEAWKIAKPLCALHHAVTYQHIIACLEPRAKQELNGLPIFLRELLKCSIEGIKK